MLLKTCDQLIYSDTEAETDLNKLKATAVDLFIDLEVILKFYTCSYTAIDVQLIKDPSKNNNCAGSPLAVNNNKRGYISSLSTSAAEPAPKLTTICN